MKKKKISHNEKGNNTIIEKVLEQSFSLVLSFIFTTALVGGSGYVLFQFPHERDSLHRQITEFNNLETEISYFNDISNIFLSGWFKNQKEIQHRSDILIYLSRNTLSNSLNKTFAKESLDWIASTLPRLTSEKGSIQGFVLTNEVEKAYQQALIREYNIQVNIIMGIDEMIRKWSSEKPAKRDERLVSLQQLVLQRALLHERKKGHTNPTLEQKLVFYFVAVWLAQLDHAIKRGTL